MVLVLLLSYCGPVVKPLNAHGLGFFILKMRQIVSKVLPSSNALTVFSQLLSLLSSPLPPLSLSTAF